MKFLLIAILILEVINLFSTIYAGVNVDKKMKDYKKSSNKIENLQEYLRSETFLKLLAVHFDMDLVLRAFAIKKENDKLRKELEDQKRINEMINPEPEI